MVTSSSTNPDVTKVGDYIFRACFDDTFQGQALAKFTKEELKFAKIAIIKDVKNDYSIGLSDAFKKAFASGDRKIVKE